MLCSLASVDLSIQIHLRLNFFSNRYFICWQIFNVIYYY